MIRAAAGIFLALHGLVHLLYFGQSIRLFEMSPGMTWPDGSWAFSKVLADSPIRTLAAVFCLLAAAGFVIGGAGFLFGQTWWRTVVVVSAGLSVTLYLLFWNGRMQHLDVQGGLGILIDGAVLAAVFLLR